MKHLSSAILAAVFLVVASQAAKAQAPKPAAPDTVAIGWAKRLLAAKHAQEAFLTGLDSAFAEQRRAPGAAQLPKVFFDSLTTYVRRVAPQLIDSLAAIYATSITLADLKELVRFYESPVGQRYGVAEVQLSLQFAGIAKLWGMRVAIDVMKDLMDKGLLSDVPPDDGR